MKFEHVHHRKLSNPWLESAQSFKQSMVVVKLQKSCRHALRIAGTCLLWRSTESASWPTWGRLYREER